MGSYRCWLDGKPVDVQVIEPDTAAIEQMIALIRGRPTRYSWLKLLADSPWSYLRAVADAIDAGEPEEERLAAKLGAGPGVQRPDALIFGTAVHRMVLGAPELVVVFDRAAADARLPEKDRAPDKAAARNGRAWEAFRAEHEELGHTILSPREYAGARRMADNILRSDDACRLLFDGTILEERILWRLGGLEISSRPDARKPGEHVTDLKSCVDSSSTAFGRAIFKMLYPAQLECYARAAEAVDGERPGEANIVAVDRKRPPRIFLLPPEALEIGAKCLTAWTERLAGCLASSNFPFDSHHVATPPAYLLGESDITAPDEAWNGELP